MPAEQTWILQQTASILTCTSCRQDRTMLDMSCSSYTFLYCIHTIILIPFYWNFSVAFLGSDRGANLVLSKKRSSIAFFSFSPILKCKIWILEGALAYCPPGVWENWVSGQINFGWRRLHLFQSKNHQIWGPKSACPGLMYGLSGQICAYGAALAP